MHSSCRWAGECSYTPYLRMRPPKFLNLCSRSVAFNHALLKAIFKREDASEGWAAIASSEWCIPNLLWKWSSAYWVADISFSSLNDWLSKAQQDSCSPKYAKLICTSNQSTILFMITIVTMTLLVIEESFPDWWHLSEGQFCDNTSAARSNLFSEQLNELCRTTAVLGHFRHSWLQRQLCVSTFDLSTNVSFRRSKCDRLTHTCPFPRERSGAVPWCLPHYLEQQLLLTPCAKLILLGFGPAPSSPATDIVWSSGHSRPPWRHLTLPSIL